MANWNTDQSMNAAPNSQNESKSDGFENSPIDRRQFMRLSAATAGVLTLPSNTLADHESEKATDLYDFIRNHVDSEYEIQTLIYLTDESGFDALDDLNLENDLYETTDPEVAVYIHITPSEAASVVEVSEVERVEFSPGANPFWKLEDYDDGVFPSLDEAVHYVGYDEMVNGMSYLSENYSDRLNFYSIGESPGHHNLLDGETDPQDVWVAELTNNVNDEESFEQKEKSIFSLSIHGDERVGAEAGVRLIERVLNGEESDLDQVLDDVVIICAFTNPDGWVAREPQSIGTVNNFQRVNAAGADANRSFPTAGWIDPAHYPAEPNGQNLQDDQPGEIDDDVPDRILEHVPDMLAIAEWIRGYENHDAVVDMHGMYTSNVFALSITPNSNQFDHGELHDAHEMTRLIGDYIYEELGDWDDNLEQFAPVLERFYDDQEDIEDLDNLPDRLYDFATSYDAINYTTTGGFRSWLAGPEEFGNLGTKGITIEMTGSNAGSEQIKEFKPGVVEIQSNAYIATIRAVAAHGASSVAAEITTDGRSTAVIHTDALDRSSDDLVFADTEATRTRVSANSEPDNSDTATVEIPTQAEEVSINIEHESEIIATLTDPDGNTYHTYDTAEENRRGAEWTVTDPDAGEWSITVEHADDDLASDDEAVEVDIVVDALLSNDEGDVLTPDPIEAIGFEQRAYHATPFQYFEDYSEFLDEEGSLEMVSIDAVCDGALIDDSSLTYDNVIVIHNEDEDNAEYIDALEEYLSEGGNLALTDTGVALLRTLDAGPASNLDEEAVSHVEHQFAALDRTEVDPDADYDEDAPTPRNLDHPLLANTRPLERELWNVPGVGYSDDYEAPMTVVDPEAFESAGGEIAARTDEDVAVGSLGNTPTEDGAGIQVLASVLPVPNQRHLHPFGLLDYGVEFQGHTIITNMLGYTQSRFVDGEETDLWASAETATPDSILEVEESE